MPHRRAPAATELVVTALVALLAGTCGGPSPKIVPPAGEVEAVEGYGNASVRGGEATLKGKFSFLFRRPGLGRIGAVDPFGRTLYFMLFRGDRAYFVLPSKKAYAEDAPQTMMERFLGFAVLPDDVIRLLGGRWPESGAGGTAGESAGEWKLERTSGGRVSGGAKDGLTFKVEEFAGSSDVPKVLSFSEAASSGRLKILTLRFNPPDRPEAFDPGFLDKFSRTSWDDLVEMMRREG